MARKANGFTKGRDRSFHFGTQQYKIIGMISHLGPQLVADGIALAKLKKNGQITAVLPVKVLQVKEILRL
jgi:2-oxoisovalerate dehydrogenase E1 component